MKRDRAERNSSQSSDKKTIAAICVGLIALTWIVFGQTLRHEFVNYDDNTYVYENPKSIAGLTLAGIS